MQNRKEVLCFRHVGAVAKDLWVAVAKDAVGVTEREVEKYELKNELEKSGDGELEELLFWNRKKMFEEVWKGVVTICKS